jgi:hypothetical protein
MQKIVHSLDDIPAFEGKVGWMIFEDKKKTEHLHQGYLDTLRVLRDQVDIVVVDVVGFKMMLNVLFYQRHLYEPVISEQEYSEYFGDLVDYLVLEPPIKQLERFSDPKMNNEVHLLLRDRCREYPVGYKENDMILKTFLCIFEQYKRRGIHIDASANMWKCGFRSFLYKHYLETYLDIQMTITEPPVDPDGLILSDSVAYKNIAARKVLKALHKGFQQNPGRMKETVLRKNPHVAQYHVFDDPRFIDGTIVETLVSKGNHKARLVSFTEKGGGQKE